MIHGQLGPARPIRRSIGMGGPHSLLLWSMVYDPLVHGLQAPTYVDDMAPLVKGGEHMLRVTFLLLALSRDVGLRIATHDCSWVVASGVTPQAKNILRWLPVAVDSDDDGATTIHGLPPHVVDSIMRVAAGPEWCHDLRARNKAFRCSIKTTLIPRGRTEAWLATANWSAFGTGMVQPGGRYLGIWLRTPGTNGARETGSGWRRAALVDAARHTWEKAQATIQSRVGMLGRHRIHGNAREAVEHTLRPRRDFSSVLSHLGPPKNCCVN